MCRFVLFLVTLLSFSDPYASAASKGDYGDSCTYSSDCKSNWCSGGKCAAGFMPIAKRN